MDVISQNGFTILAQETMNISQTRARTLYSEHKDKSFFEHLTAYVSEGPSQVLVLGKPGAVLAWRQLIGPANVALARQEFPDSLRARLGTNSVRNGFHGSADAAAAEAEIQAYFPHLPAEKVPNLLEVEDLLNAKPPPRAHVPPKQSLNDVLVEGLTQLCRVKPIGDEAVTWLANWLLRNNPNKPVLEPPVVVVEPPSDTPAPRRIVWALGADGSQRAQWARELVREFDCEHVRVESLVQAAVTQGTQYGEVIRNCRSTGKRVPTHIFTHLVENAINSNDASTYVVEGYPQNLDQALAFEQAFGEIEFVLYFDCAEDKMAKRAMAAAGADADAVFKAQEQFKEDTLPVVEHYHSFGKVLTVNTDAPDEVATRKRVLHLAGSLRPVV
jgi:nucleoside-diphosphate kinase